MILALLLALAPTGGDTAPTFRVYPDSVHLSSALDSQRILVVANNHDGSSIDWIDKAVIRIADKTIVSYSNGVLRPLTDGETHITVHARGNSLKIPITVTNATTTPDASFRLDILPIFTAAGCNAGTCHGQAKGKDGFHLSLFGYDPKGDHHALTHELPGRRINTAFPASSLLLEKVTAAVPHTGGRRIEPGSLAYTQLHRWIEAGAHPDPDTIASVTHIEVSPPDILLRGPDKQLQLLVIAHYSDGTDRDITDLAILRTSNEVSAALNPDATIRSGIPGEAFITASYDVHTVGTAVTVLPDTPPSRWYDPAANHHPANYIDDLVEHKLRRLRVRPSKICDDETYLRRIFIDVIGTLPTPAERAEFLSDKSPDRRAQLADRLIDRKEFAQLWVMQWAELLRIRSNDDISQKAALLYFEWIRDRIGENLPVDEMVRQILGASGGTFTNPPTNFYQVERDDLVLSENIAQAFLGIRIQCAKCHNHPFDRWTQDDYYGFAAFVSQVGRKSAEDPREQIIYDQHSGEISHPVGGRKMPPTFLGGPTPDLGTQDRREALAAWITSPDNPYFARSLANRVWAYFMGPGLVEPIDDFRVSNPPSNGPLLDELSKRLVSYDYDFKQLVRDITSSRAYQRSTQANETNTTDLRNAARAQVRRIRAETLLDLYCQVTEVPQKFAGLPLGARAVEIADGATTNYFLTTFGRSPRETVCACDVSLEPSLSQALHLLNGDAVHQKIAKSGLIPKWLEEGLTPTEILTHIYTRALCRLPSPEELSGLLATLATPPVPTATPDSPITTDAPATTDTPAAPITVAALEDAFWAVLNSREFLFQH